MFDNVETMLRLCVFRLCTFARTMEGTKRSRIQPGITVRVVRKQDQRSGRVTEGIVRDVLTRAHSHPHGIKVRLADGQIGRVKEIINNDEL